jgi:hypothetical protein
MKIASRAMVAALAGVLLAAPAGCGGGGPKPQLAPLPEDPKPAAPEDKPSTEKVGAQADDPPPPEEEEPPVPAGPLEVKIPAQPTTVKLVAKGKGKLAPLRYTGKAGAKQKVELALDFTSIETLGTDKNETVLPTIVLVGEAETKAVDKDGRADYAITVSGTDARDVAGARIKPDDLKVMLGSLPGLVIGGSLAASGAAGEVTMRVEKPDGLTSGALDMVRLTFPSLPHLPAEPVGVGAKWETTTTSKLAGKIDVTEVTLYELVAVKGNTFTVKGKTTVTGADQALHGGKISGIRGTGQSELTLASGALLPTYKTSLETQFTASEQDQSMTIALRVGGNVTAK